MTEQDARLAYELAVGRRVSDNHWWRTTKLLRKHKLEITVKNLQFFAQLRKEIPKSAVGIAGLLDAYHRADELTKRLKGNLKGGEIVQILSQFQVTAHRTTISRWFKKAAGGYRRKRDYSPKQVQSILIAAFLYRASNPDNKLPTAN
ncbi:MAG: hypothetical protein WA919_06485 [Coleofasciculaceae cyanobacterium]